MELRIMTDQFQVDVRSLQAGLRALQLELVADAREGSRWDLSFDIADTVMHLEVGLSEDGKPEMQEWLYRGGQPASLSECVVMLQGHVATSQVLVERTQKHAASLQFLLRQLQEISDRKSGVVRTDN